MIIKWGFLSHIAGKRTPGRLNFWKFSGGACPQTPLEVLAFGHQFHRVPPYSQASALLLQKLMKTLLVATGKVDDHYHICPPTRFNLNWTKRLLGKKLSRSYNLPKPFETLKSRKKFQKNRIEMNQSKSHKVSYDVRNPMQLCWVSNFCC